MLGGRVTDNDGGISKELKQHQPTRVKYLFIFLTFPIFSTREGSNKQNKIKLVLVVYRVK